MKNEMTIIDQGALQEWPRLERGSGQPVLTDARTDIEAARLWITVKGARSAHTFDAYRREAWRLLLWLDEEGLCLNDLTVEDVHRFYALLVNPPPSWIRPVKVSRKQRLGKTQVLRGPLSGQSLNHTRNVLSLMCTYLQDIGYLQRNPFRSSAIPSVRKPLEPRRYLDQDAWDWLWDWLSGSEEDTGLETRQLARARWLFALLYHTGMRREEVAKGQMNDFLYRDGHWSLKVVGKGNRERNITVNSALLDELVRYRQFLNLPGFPSPVEETPLLAPLHAKNAQHTMTARSVGLIVHSIVKHAARFCDDEQIRSQIETASTHWMRHTNATHRLQAGALLETTQDELGHTDPRTTRIYAKVSNKQRQHDAELLATRNRTEAE